MGFTASNASVIRSGVPQGSVLGPLLFMIYINDLPENIISQSLLYADDLKIWNTEPNQLQMDIGAINDWSERWGMPLNHSKCVHITFGRESTYTYGFNTPDGFAAIPTKDGIKDHGVTFTSNLKFSRHHEITTAKSNPTVKWGSLFSNRKTQFLRRPKFAPTKEEDEIFCNIQ